MQKKCRRYYKKFINNEYKIFCDIADIKLIRKFNKKNIVKGLTNPSLMRKAGAKDYKYYSKQILKFVKQNNII